MRHSPRLRGQLKKFYKLILTAWFNSVISIICSKLWIRICERTFHFPLAKMSLNKNSSWSQLHTRIYLKLAQILSDFYTTYSTRAHYEITTFMVIIHSTFSSDSLTSEKEERWWIERVATCNEEFIEHNPQKTRLTKYMTLKNINPSL